MSAQSNKMECPCSIGCQMQLREQAVVWKMPSQVLGTSRCLLLGTSCKNTQKSCASHLVLLHGKGKCAQGIQNHICWKGKIIAHTCQHFTKNGIFTVSFFFLKKIIDVEFCVMKDILLTCLNSLLQSMISALHAVNTLFISFMYKDTNVLIDTRHVNLAYFLSKGLFFSNLLTLLKVCNFLG